MSVKKRLIKQTMKYEQFKTYMDKLQSDRVASQDQSLAPFNISDSVEKEIIAKKEATRKARNKRKAGKNLA